MPPPIIQLLDPPVAADADGCESVERSSASFRRPASRTPLFLVRCFSSPRDTTSSLMKSFEMVTGRLSGVLPPLLASRRGDVVVVVVVITSWLSDVFSCFILLSSVAVCPSELRSRRFRPLLVWFADWQFSVLKFSSDGGAGLTSTLTVGLTSG